MLKNYIKIAFRYLIKNKTFSVVNILGLALGFTCFIVLSLFVIDELNFDSFHEDAERIYRVVQTITEQDGSIRKVAGVAPLIGTEAEKQFPEVQDQTQLIRIGRLTVGNEPTNRDYEHIWIADENFFDFFSFNLIYGDPENALREPNNLVITESVANKYFGRTDVLGERLFTNVYEGTVSGVMEDFPDNSHINMNIIHTESTWEREIDTWNDFVSSNWTSNQFITYLKMQPGADMSGFEDKLTSLISSNYGDDITYSSSFSLQPLEDIHLYSQDIEGGVNANQGNPLYVYMFSIIAFLILIIACFNYMNLSTAAASRRVREVGMRKTLGAEKPQLIMQFVGEALIISGIAFIISMALIDLLLPFIDGLTGKSLSLPFGNLNVLAGLTGVAVAAGVISSVYPAFFLSKLNPADALKKEIKIGGKNFSLRKTLVVVQFAVSIIMISATIIIYQQLNFLQEKDLGVEVDNLLVMDINSGELRNQYESIKQEFEKLSQVQHVTVSSRVPGEWKEFPVAEVEDVESESQARMIFVGADEDFLDTYNVRLIQGRNLRNDLADSASVLITESGVRELGLTNPVGKTVDITGTVWAGDFDEQDRPFTPRIVGIVEDFHFQSLREQRKPVMLASYRNPIHNIDYYTLKIRTDNWQDTIAELQEINNLFDPENPMEYTFLDSRFDEFYQADQTRGQLLLLFSGVIIFIACMGLFALASFAIENRIKEIGVRKVLGATIADIAWMLTSQFAMLVGIGFLISVPITYWVIQSWLQEFAYRISIPWWAFIVAGTVALIIAIGTISWQTIRAALMNPVKTLRSE